MAEKPIQVPYAIDTLINPAFPERWRRMNIDLKGQIFYSIYDT